MHLGHLESLRDPDASIFGVNRGEVFPAVPAQQKRCELPCFLRIAATIRRQMLQT